MRFSGLLVTCLFPSLFGKQGPPLEQSISKFHVGLPTPLIFIYLQVGLFSHTCWTTKDFSPFDCKARTKEKYRKKKNTALLPGSNKIITRPGHAEKEKKKKNSQQTLGTRTSREEVSVLAAPVQRGLPSRLWLCKNHYRGIPLHKTPVAQSPKHAFNLPKSNACQ